MAWYDECEYGKKYYYNPYTSATAYYTWANTTLSTKSYSATGLRIELPANGNSGTENIFNTGSRRSINHHSGSDFEFGFTFEYVGSNATTEMIMNFLFILYQVYTPTLKSYGIDLRVTKGGALFNKIQARAYETGGAYTDFPLDTNPLIARYVKTGSSINLTINGASIYTGTYPANGDLEAQPYHVTMQNYNKVHAADAWKYLRADISDIYIINSNMADACKGAPPSADFSYLQKNLFPPREIDFTDLSVVEAPLTGWNWTTPRESRTEQNPTCILCPGNNNVTLNIEDVFGRTSQKIENVFVQSGTFDEIVETQYPKGKGKQRVKFSIKRDV